MIQRIQTVYLLTISILGSLLFFLPIAQFIDLNNFSYTVDFMGIFSPEKKIVYPFLPYTILAIIIPTLSFISIFLYKKRILQIRLNFISIILTILFYGIILIYLYLGKKCCGEINTFTLKSGIIIPLVNIVFSYLAIKAIRKDENLVRSINRMRK